MRFQSISTGFCLIVAVMLMGASCCDDCEECPTCPDCPCEVVEFPGVIDSVAVDIELIVYSSSWYEVLDTIDLASEGSALIDIEEPGALFDPPQYYIYAQAAGFYTELYYCQQGETIEVDLDAYIENPNAITGVVFMQHDSVVDNYYAERWLTLLDPGNDPGRQETDSLGRYYFDGLWTGESYGLILEHYGWMEARVILNSAGTDYNDLFFPIPYEVDAPNIYLYPEEEMMVSVRLDFPEGTRLIKSEPEYNGGWSVRVTPEGSIDGHYDYLFYEFLTSAVPEHVAGWVLDGHRLEGEFRQLLSDLDFRGREIDDFVDFWVPRLEGAPYYAVFPQEAEALARLEIDPEPDKIMRWIFLIRSLTSPISLTPPEATEKFVRKGFTVVEWGVIDMTD